MIFEYIIICLVALVASGITLFSGFGLGTVLTPVFVVFFPVQIAVALTAIVHFLNNIFKLFLVGKHIDRNIVLRFGLPATFASLAGAQLLIWLADLKPLFDYQLLGHVFRIMPLKLIIAILLIIFALWEIVPGLKRITIDRKYLPAGGILSGFFGGLSGQQGALRGAFLANTGLSQESYISTSVAIAVLVDIPRISVYVTQFSQVSTGGNAILMLAATFSAFLGAFAGNRWIKKITMQSIQILISIMLFGIAVALGAGFI